jgi:hypothetical protein
LLDPQWVSRSGIESTRLIWIKLYIVANVRSSLTTGKHDRETPILE